jgi:hypothetical protein
MSEPEHSSLHLYGSRWVHFKVCRMYKAFRSSRDENIPNRSMRSQSTSELPKKSYLQKRSSLCPAWGIRSHSVFRLRPARLNGINTNYLKVILERNVVVKLENIIISHLHTTLRIATYYFVVWRRPIMTFFLRITFLKIYFRWFKTCKIGFLAFVHHQYFNKITTFRKLDLFLSSGKKKGQKP